MSCQFFQPSKHYLLVFYQIQKVIKSVLVLEFYIIVQRFDIGADIKSITEEIFDIKLLPMIICTNSKLLYNH